jgi:Heavy metal binding domain
MKNLKIIQIIAVVFVLSFCSTNSYAQHDHGGGGHSTMEAAKPPNGGEIKEIGKYKIEIVTELFLRKDQLRFYLYKGNFKAISNEGITGTITIKNKDGNTSTQTLQAKGDEFFVAQLEDSDSFQATVKFIIKGKTVSTVFSHMGIGHIAKKTFSCPMHPDVTSSSPGKCPKCGMNLTEESQSGNDGHNHSH